MNVKDKMEVCFYFSRHESTPIGKSLNFYKTTHGNPKAKRKGVVEYRFHFVSKPGLRRSYSCIDVKVSAQSNFLNFP